MWHVNKNVAFNINKKWIGPLEASRLGESVGGVGSKLREDNEYLNAQAENIASRLLQESDREHCLGESGQHPSLQPISAKPSGYPTLRWECSVDGILDAWVAIVYAQTEDKFRSIWITLATGFDRQEDIVNYLRTTWLPFSHEFCKYSVRKHRNYGFRANSRIEGSHHALKALLPAKRGSLTALLETTMKLINLQTTRLEQKLTRQEERLDSRQL